MKKTLLILIPAAIVVLLSFEVKDKIWSQSGNTTTSAASGQASVRNTTPVHSYPAFYKGIYLTVSSGRDTATLKRFIAQAKQSHVNTFVIDVQRGASPHCAITKENVDLCLQSGIHPIARVVVFTDGLSHYPVSQELINNRLSVAREACINGFREVQFDYIRFTDYRVRGRVPLEERYQFIEGFLLNARNHLKKYNVKTAADIFGRIPLNKSDAIGQRMEGLDKVVDIICPMAYPSHYTWSRKLQSDPYHTVFLTSKKANERTRKAEIVTWIQAFKIRVDISGLSYDKYVSAQVKATHDAGIRGFILWNARQDYQVPLKALRDYYSSGGTVSKASQAAGNDGTL